MKNLWMLLLLCLSLSGCKDKTVDPEDYTGDYPYHKEDGVRIQTYDNPKLMGPKWNSPMDGTCQLFFNDHGWNHWPAISANSGRYATGTTCNINFSGASGLGCIQETIGFIIPAKVGLYKYLDGSMKAYFYTLDCDAPKDRIEIDKQADNWVNIAQYDSLIRPDELEGSFDITFKIVRKNLIYSIVYPNTIRMRGSFKQRIRVQ